MKKFDTFQTLARGVKGLVAVMLLMLMAVGGALAQTTYSHSIEAKTFSSFGTQTLSGVMWTASGSETSYFGYDATKGQQFGSGSSACTTLNLQTSDILGEISSVKVNTSGAKSIEATFKVKVGDTYFLSEGNEQISLTQNATNYTFVGSASGAISLEWTQTSSKAIYIKSIEVIYTTSPAAVEAPTFTPVAGNYFAAQNVTLASATEGATIYYTVDGTTPTIESLLYQGPIAVSENTTIKAIAILGEDESSVATANYVINIPVEVATIEAFKAAEHNDNTIYKINGDVKVLGQYDNKKYTFIQDMGQGTYAALCIFDNNGSNINAYNPGDVISGGVYGTYDLYHNLIEMNPVEGLPSAEGTPGEVIAPDVRTLANVIDYYNWFESKLVTIKGLTFTESSTFGTTAATRGVVAVQGDDTINVYNGWGAITGVEVSEGMTADVTGFISRYNDILEIIPRGSEDIVEVVGPAVAPWTATFEDATENSAWEINNRTYSNKWFIGQAQGFDNNKLYISSNNGVTNKYIAEYSYVEASRAIVIPQNGGVLSFDYRANGNDNDYVQVAIVKEGGNRTNLATLHGANEWTNATYTISPDMAGEATLVFLWTNQAANANQFPAAIDNVSLMESSCSQPTALQATVEETTATISWTGDAEAYLLQYKLDDHSEWYSINTTENTVVLNNLQGNSNYNIRVQSVCGDDASAWVEGHFVVKCQNLIIDEEEVTFGNGTSTYYYHFPLSAYYYHSYTQQLFTEEELAAMGITAGSQMSAISFNYFWGTATTRPITIWLGTTTMTSLSSAFVPKDENFVQVYSNNCQEFSNSNENWVKLSFDQSFTYNGGSLVVAVLSNKENGECFTQYGSTSRFYLNSQQGKARYHSDDYNEITFDASGMPQSGYNRTVSSSDYRNNIKFDATKFVCGDVETCPAVTNVQVDNITPNSAELTWNRGNESETNFKVEYYAEGSTDVVSVLVEDTAYTLSDLAQLTNYTVKVQALCGENNTSEPVEIEFATPGICPSVSDIQSSNASNTTTLTWTPDGEETAWLVQFKPAEAGDNEWISINVNALPTTTFGGLMATTTYDVRVKALCDPADEENQSEWANHEFTSGCAAFDVPFAETFDSYNMPTCWDVDGFRFSGGYAYSYDLDAWIMTPAINIPSDETTYLAFDVKGYGNFSVMASYRGTDASRFAEIYSGEIESGSNYTQVVVPMADNLKGRQVYFKIVNNADQYQYIDNLSVDYCPFVPANLTATNITENSAVLTWECAELANNFQVKVGENIVDVEGAKTYTLTGLDASTSYTFYVRTQCGEDSYGDWSAEKTFTTACAAYTIPYFEGFESGYTNASAVAGCISQEAESGSSVWTANRWSTDYNRAPRTGSWNAYLQYGNSRWMYIPMHFEANKQYVFEMYARQDGSSGCSMKVSYGAENTSSAMTNSIVNTTTIGSSFVKLTGTFAPTATGDYYVGIYAELNYDPWYVSIDDISVIELPTCGTPTLAVNGTTATITQGSIGEPESYDLQIGNQIETVPATQTTFTITDVFTDLVYGNTYQMQVRAICGEGDTSAWSAAVDFTYEVAYTMEYGQTREITTCLGTLYDNGGPQGNYQNNSNDVMVIYPASEYSVVRLQGNYSTESNWDKIYIYDGVGTEGTPIYNAISGSGYIDATSTTGALTVKFTSDGSGQYSGFALNISCKQVVFEKDLAINSIDPIAWACDQSDAKVTINVENTGFADTITSFEARYVINTQAPVSETVNCNLAPGETMSYTFNTTPVFEDGENTVHAIVDMEGDMQVENNYTDPIIVSLLEPETVPYTPTLSADLVNKGWNVVDANNDGITMDINAKAIVYTFNDTLAANDWMFTPCIEMPAGTYNVYYDYRANSSLNEKFEVFYGAGANVAAMTNEVANHDFNNTDYETVMQTITVAEDGIYNFGFHAMSLAGNLGFNIANFKVYPVVDVTVTSGENGTVTPNGVVPVNYGENLNLTIVPNTMYHVAGVWVDDVQVMSEDPYNSNFMFYTLENVTEPHNVFVDYKLEYHIIKSVANYNPAYTDVPGEFIPAATDTLIDPDPVTVNFAAAPHYHLYSLEMAMMNEEDMVDVTADVVDNGDHTYSYLTPELVVANYYLRATFRRDTVAVNYLVNTGKGYADQSDVLAQGAQYATWWDYSVANDVDAVANIRPYTTGDAHSDYHIVNVNVNGEDMGVIDTYTFENIQEDQNIAIDFGYQVTTSIRNYVPTYLESEEVRGTIEPATQLVAEGEATVVYGTVQEHFHLYNLFVDGVDMIDQVVFDGNNYSLTIDSTIANYHIEAVVKIDTFGIHYDVMDGQGYADASDLLVAPADYITWVNYGDDFMMNLAPGRGFSIGEVVVDGIEMYTANNYLFEYVEEHHYVAVSFVPNDYTITTNAYGHGTVTDGMSFTYDPESPVNYEFTATAEEGYHISAIVINDAEIDLTGVTDTYTQTLENVAANYVINAIFEINTYNMVSEASLGGTITPEGLQVVNHGTDLTYEIVADEGRYISSITIDGETTEYTQADNVTNYIQLFTSINADHSVSATFAVKHFTITAEVNEDANHGTIDGESSFSGEFSYGSNQTLNFIPEANYQVSDVVVDGQSVGAVTSYEFVNITAEHNVVVSFAPIQYTLTATSNVDACTITPASTTVQAGSNVNYTLTVATGYHLLNVIANGEEVNVVANAFTIENVQEDYEIFANFAPNYVTVTVEQPAHATITPGTMTYAYGATPSYVIVPEVGYDVTAVHAGNALVNVTYNNGIGSFTLNPVTADLTVTATTAIKTFTITATQAAHGTISPAAVQTVNYGGNVTYTITPDDYYEIVDVLVDGSSRGALSTYTFNNVTANHTIEAVFEAACMTPSRLTVVYVDTNSATLTWEGNAASYEVRYRAAGETNFTTQTVNTNTITLTGLTENTLYAWGVKANCTATLSSDWAESAFRTAAIVIPPVGISTADLSSIKVYSHLNNVYIVNENGIAIDNVTIYNIFGAQVYSGKANNNPEIISLDVANGNYIVRLSTENGVGVYKLSIVR